MLLTRSIREMYEFERFIFSPGLVFHRKIARSLRFEGKAHVQSCRSSFRCSSPLFADGEIYLDKSAQSEAGLRVIYLLCSIFQFRRNSGESAYRRSARLLKSRNSRDSFALWIRAVTHIYYFCCSTSIYNVIYILVMNDKIATK